MYAHSKISLAPAFFLLLLNSSLFGQLEISEQSLLPTHLTAAREFNLFLDSTLQQSLKLDERPVFVWSNPRRMLGGQSGHVFLWKLGERPFAVCTIYSFGDKGVPANRQIVYEWHTLSESTLLAQRNPNESQWLPKSGVRFQAIRSAKLPAEKTTRQKLEVSSIVSKFEIDSRDPQGQRWPLRALAKPLCAYETENGIGALIGWIGDTGNDPEFMVLLEVRKEAGIRSWCFAPIRMTDHELNVRVDDEIVWQSVRSANDTGTHDAENLYFRFRDKVLPLLIPSENASLRP